MPLPPKQGTCVECGRVGPVAGNKGQGYRCPLHYLRYRNRVNKKEAARRGYAKARKLYLSEHPYCEARLASCTGAATEVHHKKGRTGDLLTDPTYFMAVCHTCHMEIEEMGAEVYERGFKIKRTT